MKKVMILMLAVVGFAGVANSSIEADVDANRYSRINDILTDNFSGLQIQDNLIAKSNELHWIDAKRYCSTLTLAGKAGWRMPTRAELVYVYKLRHLLINAGSHYYLTSEMGKMERILSGRFVSTPYIVGINNQNWDDGTVQLAIQYAGVNTEGYVKCVRGKVFGTKSELEEEARKTRKKIIYNRYIPIHLAEYKKAKKNNLLKVYQGFIKKYPDAIQVSKALKAIYNIVDKENNIAGYEWFIKTYPKASQVKDAIEKVHSMAFEEAQDIDSISAYNTFIIAYPSASQVKKANALASDLEYYKYNDTLPPWFRSIMPDFVASFFNSIFGIFSSDEKKSRALLIKAKQIERDGNEYYGSKKDGYVIIANRMYGLLQEEYDDTDATLRYLESQEFKDFVRTFKSVMRGISSKLDNIARYSSEILEVSKKGFADEKADHDMSEYYTKQHRAWEKQMHLQDKGYM